MQASEQAECGAGFGTRPCYLSVVRNKWYKCIHLMDYYSSVRYLLGSLVFTCHHRTILWLSWHLTPRGETRDHGEMSETCTDKA